MPDLLLTAIQYTGYISIIKLLLFLASFLVSLPLVTWIYHDAKTVETKELFWTGIVFAAVASAAFIWLIVPVFVVAMLFYIIAVAATALSYVTHRNSRVMDYDRILTPEHIKSLFVNKQKKLEALKAFLFVTANNNEVPMPQPKTPDFFGYKTAHDLFTDAIWRRASDVIFIPTAQECRVIYQIDGAAIKRPSMSREQMDYFIRFMKNVGDLDVKEKRKPQKGKFRIQRVKESFEWEITTAGSTAGEQIKIRRIMYQQVGTLTEFGLMSDQVRQLNDLQKLKQGLFIVSGPPRSGVTTTFYGLLKNHDAFMNSINTLETEPSAQLPNITQELFTLTDTGTTTFAKKLKAMIRMGPDIVGVAGCPDNETAKVICDAAKDKKLVYLVMQADSVIKALTNWIQLVGNKQVALGNLLGVSNQRLLRILCEECKQAYAPNRELIRKFSLPPEKTKVLHRAGKVQYDKHGKPFACQNCQGTGFVGRTGVFETIVITEQLRKALGQAQTIPEIGSQLRGAKMLYLQEQALRKIMAGTTSINEMVRVFTKTQKKKQKSQTK